MKKLICFMLALCLTFPVFAEVFGDLADYDWARASIYEMQEKGIINGIGGGNYDPEGNVTYEQLAKMVVLAFKMELKLPEKPTYSDVGAERWSYQYIESAKLLFGKNGEKFAPDSLMTRYEVIKVIASAVVNGSTEGFAQIEFADNGAMTEDMRLWASIAANLGIVQGYTDNTFRPNVNVSRAETAVILSRALKRKIIKNEETPAPTASPVATPAPAETPEVTPIPEEIPQHDETAEISARMDFFVVTGVAQVSVNGDETAQLKGFYNGAETSFTCEKATVKNAKGDTDASEIAVGDVLTAVRDISGKVRNIFILFSSGDVYEGNNVINPYPDEKVQIASSGSIDFYFGLVRMRSGNTILQVFDDTIEARNDINSAMGVINEETNIYEYNPDNKKIKLADAGDIMQDKTASENAYSDTGTFVLVRSLDSLLKDILIINNKG